jgi:hypothetical protein
MKASDLPPWEELDWGRFPYLVAERIQQLDPDTRLLAALAEPGSTRIKVEDRDWLHVWVGNSDPIDLGSFHRSALAHTTSPGSMN